MKHARWLPPLLAVWLSVSPAAVGQTVCDSTLKPAKNPLAYGPRQDRCEGVYAVAVAGTPLYIASLTSRFEDYDPATDPTLHLSWAAPTVEPLFILVRAIQPDMYYRMDTQRPATAVGYDWPTGILSALRLRRLDLGALAWTRRKAGAGYLRIHVPLSITRSKSQASTNGYSLVVYPARDLQEVYLTLGPADSLGRPKSDQLVKRQEPQQQFFYPAERPIRLTLPRLDPPGLYYLQVSAKLANGSPAGAEDLLIDTSVR
ncbi:MAG TPA: hypothetical protein VJQ44_07345 [Gemmatimonadales bacterium]|nr:hypothetical protein [Gemmatimonadales bacterium]